MYIIFIVCISFCSLCFTSLSSLCKIILFSDQDELKEATSEIQAGLEGGWLNPVIGHEYPLNDVAEAHREIISGTGAKGKIVLLI